MLAYISLNSDEQSFNEEIWNIAQKETANINSAILIKNAKNKRQQKLECIGNIYFKMMDREENKKISKKEDEEEIEDFILEHYLNLSNEIDSNIAQIINDYFDYLVNKDDLIYVIRRLREYYSEYEINNGSDKFLLTSVVSYELELKSLYKELKICNATAYKQVIKNIESLNKTLSQLLGDLNILKKQEKQNKETDNCFASWVKKITEENVEVKIPKVKDDDIDFLVKKQLECIKQALS